MLFHDIIPPFQQHGAVVVQPLPPHAHHYIQHLLNQIAEVKNELLIERAHRVFLEERCLFLQNQIHANASNTSDDSIEIVDNAVIVVE